VTRGSISPAPPVAEGTGLPWDVTVDDAVAAIAEARARHGDTFVAHSGRDHYLFTFSPVGVESFYTLPEEIASKGLADYLMLRRKLPDEIFDGRRTLPASLFRRDDVTSYLVNLDQALEQTVAELGPEGTVDLFDLTRRLGHRMGLASWAGPGSTQADTFDRLVAAFDTLDGSDAFVHPDAMAAVASSDKRAERAALNDVVELVSIAVRRLDSGQTTDDALFGRIVEAWSSEPPDARTRGIALDVALIHIASMSNLMAALGWAFVDLLEHPTHLRLVAAGEGAGTPLRAGKHAVGAALDHVAHRVGSRRLQHRRRVLPRARGLDDRTLLPLLNTSAAPGLRDWDPDRWHRHRLADPTALPSPMLVTAFGHGRHSCPAQPFSLAAMTAAMTHLLGRYEMTPHWTRHPRPVPAQIGGVARAAELCVIRYCATR
jgi:cytochrome P450